MGPVVRAPLVACLLVLVASMASGAPVKVQHDAVVAGVAYVPQMQCVMAFPLSGSDRCVIDSEARLLTHVRARVVGDAHVRVVLDRIDGDTRYQVASLTCTGGLCSAPVVEYTSDLRLYQLQVDVSGSQGAIVSVDAVYQLGANRLP